MIQLELLPAQIFEELTITPDESHSESAPEQDFGLSLDALLASLSPNEEARGERLEASRRPEAELLPQRNAREGTPALLAEQRRTPRLIELAPVPLHQEVRAESARPQSTNESNPQRSPIALPRVAHAPEREIAPSQARPAPVAPAFSEGADPVEVGQPAKHTAPVVPRDSVDVLAKASPDVSRPPEPRSLPVASFAESRVVERDRLASLQTGPVLKKLPVAPEREAAPPHARPFEDGASGAPRRLEGVVLDADTRAAEATRAPRALPTTDTVTTSFAGSTLDPAGTVVGSADRSQAPTGPVPTSAIPHQVELMATRGGGAARLRLHPAQLGEVEITVTMRGNTVDVVIRADQPAAEMAVLAQRELLVEALGSRDLRMENLDVSSMRDHGTSDHEGSDEPGGRQLAEDRASSREARMNRNRPTPNPIEAPTTRSTQSAGIDLRI
jgi:hypothetical protein